MVKRTNSRQDSLPDEYVPESIRPEDRKRRKSIAYACGYEDKPNSFGMFHGPNPDLKQMLDVVPDREDESPCIIRFNLDGTDEVLYRWDESKRCWRKQK